MAEHWYSEDGTLVAAGTKGAWPSVTTILDAAAKPALDDWRARVGVEEAEEKNRIARERGTYVHQTVEALFKKRIVLIDGRFVGGDETTRPYVNGFLSWWQGIEDKGLLHSELFLRSKKYKYAGTADLICVIDGVLWLIDIKTTSQHKKEHGMQLKAYQQAYFEMFGKRPKMAVLKLTDTTQKGWQWREYTEPLAPFLGLKQWFMWTVRKRKPIADKAGGWAPDDVAKREYALEA